MTITILDFSTAKVFIENVPDNLFDFEADAVLEHFSRRLDIRETDCQYIMGDLDIVDNR